MTKLSVAAVLLLVVVPLCMYTGALLVGIQLGRALERRPDGAGGVRFSLRGALDYVTKEIWDINVLGRRRNRWEYVSDLVLVPVVRAVAAATPASHHGERTSRQSYNDDHVALSSFYQDILKSSASVTPSTTQRYHNHTAPKGVISVGPWGGRSGGQPFYMHGSSAPRLRSIILYHSGAIHSLSCEYTLAGDYKGNRIIKHRVAGPWGRSNSFGSTGVRAMIDLPLGEHITAVEGTTGHFANVPGVVITSLTFRTNAGRTYGPYGSVAAGSHHFSVPAADGACIVGFWGRSGWLLDAIGVYVKPSCSSDTAYNKKYASRRQGRY